SRLPGSEEFFASSICRFSSARRSASGLHGPLGFSYRSTYAPSARPDQDRGQVAPSSSSSFLSLPPSVSSPSLSLPGLCFLSGTFFSLLALPSLLSPLPPKTVSRTVNAPRPIASP